MWNRQTQGIHKSSPNGAVFGDIFSLTLAITWVFVAWLSVRGLSPQIWQRLEHEAVSGENANATERLSGTIGKPWGLIHAGFSCSLLSLVIAHPGLAVKQSGKCNAYACAHERGARLERKSLRRLLFSSVRSYCMQAPSLELIMTAGVASVRICA